MKFRHFNGGFLVRKTGNMAKADSAIALMGNHEYNALTYAWKKHKRLFRKRVQGV